jgi:hypothetical protein
MRRVQFGTSPAARECLSSTVSTNTSQAEPLHTTTTQSPHQTTPGQLCWSIRKPDGTTLTCELHDQGQRGVELQLLRDGQFLFGRRLHDRSAAVVKADDLKTEHIRDGGELIP